MEKTFPGMKAVTIINAVLLALSLAGCVYILTAKVGAYYFVSAIVELLAMIFAVIYYEKGYKKDAAKYYRLFMLFYAFTYLAEILTGALSYDALGVESPVSATILFSMILYGNTLILAVGKDIGKKVSYILCIFNAVFYALPIIGCVIPGFIAFDSVTIMTSNIILYCIWFVVALNALVMTVAKYEDKKARGTK